MRPEWGSRVTEGQRRVLAKYEHLSKDELREMGKQGKLSASSVAYLLAAKAASEVGVAFQYSTDHEPDATAVLLQEIGRLHAENVKLRGRVRALERSRERWRAEAKAWKWGAMQR
jgi:hypothetical protein